MLAASLYLRGRRMPHDRSPLKRFHGKRLARLEGSRAREGRALPWKCRVQDRVHDQEGGQARGDQRGEGRLRASKAASEAMGLVGVPATVGLKEGAASSVAGPHEVKLLGEVLTRSVEPGSN